MVKDTLKGYLGRPVVARVQLCIMAYDSVVSLQYEVKACFGGQNAWYLGFRAQGIQALRAVGAFIASG